MKIFKSVLILGLIFSVSLDQALSQTAVKILLDDKKLLKSCNTPKVFKTIDSLADSFEKKSRKIKPKKMAEWVEESNREKAKELTLARILFPYMLPSYLPAKASYEDCWSHLYEIKKGENKQLEWRRCVNNLYGGRPSPYVLRIIKCVRQPTPKPAAPSRGKRPQK